jgi:hypothetical protein
MFSRLTASNVTIVGTTRLDAGKDVIVRVRSHTVLRQFWGFLASFYRNATIVIY